MRTRSSIILLALALSALNVPAQSPWQPGHAGIGFAQSRGKQWVQLVSSPELAVKAGRNVLALRFTVQTGLHINSHAPHSPYLIPTTLTLHQPDGMQIARIEYPQGVDYHFKFSPKDALSVYTGEFSLLVPVRARAGQHILHGQLRYQACDDSTCNPPKTLPLTLDVIAR